MAKLFILYLTTAPVLMRNMPISFSAFFRRFHRADEFEGLGIGLSIAHRIIQRYGGRIWAEAEVNKGAVFYFTLR